MEKLFRADQGESMIRSIHVLGMCAVVVAATLAFAAPAGAAGNGAMAVDCDPGAKGIQTSCSYPSSGGDATFKVAVDATKIPPGGYQALETNIHFDDKVLDYLPAKTANAEFKWPDCVFAARAPAYQLKGQVPLGCTIGPSNGPKTKYTSSGPSRYTGPAIEIKMSCAKGGTSKLSLPQKDSHYIDKDDRNLTATTSGATVKCGKAKSSSSKPSSESGSKSSSQSQSASTSNPKTAKDCAGLKGKQLASCQALVRKFAQLNPSSATGTEQDDSGGGLSTPVVILIVVGGLAALAGGAYAIRRLRARRG